MKLQVKFHMEIQIEIRFQTPTFVIAAGTVVVLVADLLVRYALARCTFEFAVLADAVRVDAGGFAVHFVGAVWRSGRGERGAGLVGHC